MSLTASAATAVLTAFADNPDGGENRWGDQLNDQRDLYTQFVISCALGLSAFLAFCVCSSVSILMLHLLTSLAVDPATKMDRALCCATTTTKCCFAATGASGYPFRLDSSSSSNH